MTGTAGSTGTEINPGTAVYGILFSDGSCGGWQCDRQSKIDHAAWCKAVGLSPVAIVHLRMKSETLIEVPADV